LDRTSQCAKQWAKDRFHRSTPCLVRDDQRLIDPNDLEADARTKLLNGACSFVERGCARLLECQRCAVGEDVCDRATISAGPGGIETGKD
jgi:hypothetical protein